MYIHTLLLAFLTKRIQMKRTKKSEVGTNKREQKLRTNLSIHTLPNAMFSEINTPFFLYLGHYLITRMSDLNSGMAFKFFINVTVY